MFPVQLGLERRRIKAYIARELGLGEHEIRVCAGPPVLVCVYGWWSDEDGNEDAEVQAYHPDIEGISFNDIAEAIGGMAATCARIALPVGAESHYSALRDSIEKHGCQVPILVTDRGEIIDGRQRKKACDELGRQCPAVVVSGLDLRNRQDVRLELNCCRRQMTRREKRQVIEMILRKLPTVTDRSVARLAGVDHKTVAVIRERLENAGVISRTPVRKGSDGKKYKATRIHVSTRKQTERAMAVMQELGGDLPRREITLHQAEQLARSLKSSERRQKWKSAPPLPAGSICISHGDFRKLNCPDQSAQLILTDPPYDRNALPLWRDLANFAKRVLRPDGLLVAYSGVMFLPEVIQALSSQLSFVWQLVLIHAENQGIVQSRNINGGYKPILIYSVGRTRCPSVLTDVIRGEGKEKDFHDWQQNIDEMIYLIERLTNVDDLVVDPFGGGFTTAAACYRLRRRCISCDIDANAVQAGLARLEEERALVSRQAMPVFPPLAGVDGGN